MSERWVISEENAEGYLRARGWVQPDEAVRVRRLTGGVSNHVLRVEREWAPDLVIKQARERLDVKEVWTCPVERIWRERDVMVLCERLIAAEEKTPTDFVWETPRLVHEDPENYLIAIMAAETTQSSWKEQLLAGDLRNEVATACGRLMGVIHAGSWKDSAVAKEVGGREFFDMLRVDPYYRHVARNFLDLRPALERLERSLDSHCVCLVHGDFSPKNLLVDSSKLTLIDFEVGHYGDPAFDVGFFLSHLTLKTIRGAGRREEHLGLIDAFWNAYQARMRTALDEAEWDSLRRRCLWNLGGCGIARLDGKSTIDYLDATQSQFAREMFRDWLLDDRSRLDARRIRDAFST